MLDLADGDVIKTTSKLVIGQNIVGSLVEKKIYMAIK